MGSYLNWHFELQVSGGRAFDSRYNHMELSWYDRTVQTGNCQSYHFGVRRRMFESVEKYIKRVRKKGEQSMNRRITLLKENEAANMMFFNLDTKYVDDDV